MPHAASTSGVGWGDGAHQAAAPCAQCILLAAVRRRGLGASEAVGDDD